MNSTHDSLTSILLIETDAGETMRNLCAFKKAVDPKFSLAYIGKKIDFPSRGTLSETIKGRRHWPRKYWKPMARVLGLDDSQTELLILLLERDACVTPVEKDAFSSRIEGVRRFLRQRFFKVDLNHGLTLLASDVLCYFGIPPNAPTERMIIDYFGKSRVMEIRKALHILKANGLIEKVGDAYQRTEKTKPFFAFHQNEAEYATAYIREAVQDAEHQVPHWLFRHEEACFGSTTMSVRKEHYQRLLTQIKKDVFRYFSELETNEGDTLIRFNMQIYPLKT